VSKKSSRDHCGENLRVTNRTTPAGSHTSLGNTGMLNNAYKIKIPNYMIKILGCSRKNVFEIMKKINSVLGCDTSLQVCNSPCFDGQ